MSFLEGLFKSLPEAALATVIAAIIAAVVAVVVALINAWSTRYIARETAHRQFRAEVADAAVAATKQLLADIHTFDQIRRNGSSDDWRDAVVRTFPMGVRLRTDLRAPDHSVLASAIRVFRGRRDNLDILLSIRHRNEPPSPLELSEARVYILEIADVVQTAAEGYVFGVRSATRRARRALEDLDPKETLTKRIERLRPSVDETRTTRA